MKVVEQKPLKATRKYSVLSCPITGLSCLEKQPQRQKTFKQSQIECLCVFIAMSGLVEYVQVDIATDVDWLVHLSFFKARLIPFFTPDNDM